MPDKYSKSWVSKFDDEWYISLRLAERGLFDQCITWAKRCGDNGTIVQRNWSTFAATMGCDLRTARKITVKMHEACKILILSESPTLILQIVNYEKHQRVRQAKDCIPAAKMQHDYPLEPKGTERNRKEERADAPDIPFKQIVEDLNQKTGRTGRYKLDWKGKQIQTLIRARFNDGATFEDFLHVNAVKSAEWKEDPKMSTHLVPDTLYCLKHFKTYAKQMPKPPELRGMTYAQEHDHYAKHRATDRSQSDFTPGDTDAVVNAALARAKVEREALRKCYTDKCRFEGIEWTKDGEREYLAKNEEPAS
jgi:uncharacterized phage protein (TIGR02220 family)